LDTYSDYMTTGVIPPRPVRRVGLSPLPVAVLVGLPATGLFAALAVVAVALAQPTLAVAAGSLAAFVVSSATGAVMLAMRGRRSPGRPRLTMIGVALMVWGLGQGLISYDMWTNSYNYPSIGDAIALVGAPFAIAGLIRAARAGARALDVARLALDASLIGASATILLWRLVFEGRLFVGGVDTRGADAGGVLALVVILAECTVLALVLMVWLRDLDNGLLIALVGVATYTVADLITVHAVTVPGGLWPWQTAVLWCFAWPAIGLGMLLFAPVRRTAAARGRELQRSDARVTIATTVIALLLLAGGVFTIFYQRRFDRVTVVVALLVIVVFAAREVVIGLQRQAMLGSLTHLAFHDPLTGLGNRRALTNTLDALDSTANAHVLTLDLDGFKEVNDILGHVRGDALLVAVSEHLEQCLPADAQVFRIGGDEFAVVVVGTDDRALSIAERLLESVRKAAESVPGVGAVRTSASIGMARLGVVDGAAQPAQPAGSDVLVGLVESGVALRAAKEAGRDRVELYDGTVAAQHRRGLLVERRLREAIAQGAVVPHYQPVVDLRTRTVCGFEALARWEDPELGTVGPDEFIPVAERCGLVATLGAAMLSRAIKDVAEVLRTAPDLGPLRMGVNGSVAQLRRQGFAAHVIKHLDEHQLPHGVLVVEVTESLFVDIDDPAVRELGKLLAAGVHVAIDDFGSGYSNLGYLSRVPASILKIDSGLTSRVLHDHRSRAVLSSIVALADGLSLDVVVEGIESAAVHELVCEIGGRFGQGWLYGAAVPFAEVVESVRAINAGALLPQQRQSP